MLNTKRNKLLIFMKDKYKVNSFLLNANPYKRMLIYVDLPETYARLQ